MNEEAAGSTDEEEHAEAQDVNDSDKTVVVAAADGDDHDDGSVGKDPRNDADKRPTFFFSLKVHLFVESRVVVNLLFLCFFTEVLVI